MKKLPGLSFKIGSCLIALLGSSGGQTASKMPSLPSGFSDLDTTPVDLLDPFGGSFSGLNFSLTLDSRYDSNVYQSAGTPQDPTLSDLSFRPAFSAQYQRSKNAWNLNGSANYGRQEYLKQESLNAPFYNLSIGGGYQGSKLSISANLSNSLSSGVNLRVGSFLEQESFSESLNARYQFSPKTSLAASWSTSDQQSNTEGFSNTNSENLSFSSLWRYSPLLEFGPGYRWGTRSGSFASEIETSGATLNLDYQLAAKVNFNSTIGMNSFAGAGFTAEDSTHWSLALRYQASRLWGLSLEAIKDSQASLSAQGGFEEVTAIRVAHTRRILRSSLALTAGTESRTTIRQAGVAAAQFDFDTITLGCTWSKPVWNDQARIALTLSYRDLTYQNTDRDYDSVQVSSSLTWKF